MRGSKKMAATLTCEYCGTRLIDSPIASEDLNLYQERYVNRLRSKRFSARSIQKNLVEARQKIWKVIYGKSLEAPPKQKDPAFEAMFDLLIATEGLFNMMSDKLDRELAKHGQNRV